MRAQINLEISSSILLVRRCTFKKYKKLTTININPKKEIGKMKKLMIFTFAVFALIFTSNPVLAGENVNSTKIFGVGSFEIIDKGDVKKICFDNYYDSSGKKCFVVDANTKFQVVKPNIWNDYLLPVDDAAIPQFDLYEGNKVHYFVYPNKQNICLKVVIIPY